MIKILLIVAAIGSLFWMGMELDKRGYQRGKAEANQLAGEAIALQNRKIGELIQKSDKELKTARLRLKAQRRNADEQIRSLLAKYKELENQWITLVHSCIVVFVYGLPDKGCPDFIVPDRPRADSGDRLPRAENKDNYRRPSDRYERLEASYRG